MTKDSYYFPHFCNADNDPKIMKLKRVHGWAGKGLYFTFLEILRQQTDFKYPLSGVEDLAFNWHVGKEILFSIINDFELFVIEDNKFFSPKQIEYLQPYLNMKEQRRNAGIASGISRKMKSLNGCSTDVQRELNENEQSKVKEIKESKLNKVNNNKEKKPKKVYSGEIINFTSLLSSHFDKELVERLNKTEKWQWVDSVHKLINIDKFSIELIEKAVKAARSDEFWQKNFLSLCKLRKKNDDGVKYINVFLQLANSHAKIEPVKTNAELIDEAKKEILKLEK